MKNVVKDQECGGLALLKKFKFCPKCVLVKFNSLMLLRAVLSLKICQ